MSAGADDAAMRERNLQTAGDAAAFTAGVALFDELLRAAERMAMNAHEAGPMNLDGSTRSGPLALFALEFLNRVIRRPELAMGFAGARPMVEMNTDSVMGSL